MNPQDIEDLYELSPAQQGMFFHSMAGRSPELLVEQFVCVFEGSLATGRLRAACQEVTARHTALRTSFHLGDMDKPLQVVHRHVELPWQELDWRAVPGNEVTARLDASLAEDRMRGFDPGSAPLMRFFLIRRPDDRYQFVWSHHHLLLDGWSLPVVIQEILACYDALSKGVPAALPPAQPYREYIAYLQGRQRADAERFWRERIGDLGEPTAVGSGRAPATGGEQAIAEVSVRLPAEVATRLTTLAREQRVTSSVVFQAVWALVLGAHSQRQSVVFGMTVAGRPAELPALASCVGLFINTLPVRMAIQRDQRVLELLRSTQAERLELHEHEHTPLADIQEWSGVPRGRPLFHSIVVFENFPQRVSVDTLAAGDVTIFGGKSQYPLTILVDPEHGFSIRLLYHQEVIEHMLASALARAMSQLVSAVVSAPESTVGALLDAVRVPRATGEPAGAAPGAATGGARDRAASAPPRTPLESTLWHIWTELLGTRNVGIHDDFFALGGHSLLATQAISRIRQAFGTDIPLKVLFTGGQTIAELASTIEEHLVARADEDELAVLYADLENMSDEDAERLLAQEGEPS